MREKIEKKKEQAKEFVKKNWRKALVYGAAGYGVFKAGLEIYAAYRGYPEGVLHFHANEEEDCIDLDIIGKGRHGEIFSVLKGMHVNPDEMISLRDWIDETIEPVPENDEATE